VTLVSHVNLIVACITRTFQRVPYTKGSTNLSCPATFLAKRSCDTRKVKSVSQTESRTGRTVFVRLRENEDLLNAIKARAEQNSIHAGFFFLIGTVKRAVLGYYKEGKYKQIEVAGPLEIVSCMGNLSLREDGELVAHAHIAVADEEGRMFGGHLLPGCPIDATGELILVETPEVKLKRVLEKKLNLYLWHLGE
jgi:predicted DNA-binding protein with PD1-like motif